MQLGFPGGTFVLHLLHVSESSLDAGFATYGGNKTTSGKKSCIAIQEKIGRISKTFFCEWPAPFDSPWNSERLSSSDHRILMHGSRLTAQINFCHPSILRIVFILFVFEFKKS